MIEIELTGSGGEPINLLRTFRSHGVASLPPLFFDSSEPSLTITIALDHSVRTVVVVPRGKNRMAVIIKGPTASNSLKNKIIREIRHMFRLDDDLSEFYSMVAKDPALSWVAEGAGRMIRSQTIFEDIVKTICTTNCGWSSTVRMVESLVEHLGRVAPGAPETGLRGRAFPTPNKIASTEKEFFSKVARTGYRGEYMLSFARMVVAGEIDLTELERGSSTNLCDDEVEHRLMKIRGIGPYAASHIMMMLGRYSRLILDSWTRPKYASLMGCQSVKDIEIQKRFRSY